MPSILWIENVNNLYLENIKFKYDPSPVFKGEYLSDTEDGLNAIISPLVLNKNIDKNIPYCMNQFISGSLISKSLTNGFGLSNKMIKQDSNYYYNKSELRDSIKNEAILTWHQSGLTNFTIYISECKNVFLKNCWISNSISYAILTENCENIYADRLFIKPESENLFVGPRDGWKIFRCYGNINISNTEINGVRMDAQNIHGTIMVLRDIIDEYSIEVSYKGKLGNFNEQDSFKTIFRYKDKSEMLRLSCWKYLYRIAETKEENPNIGSTMYVPGRKPNFENRIIIRFSETHNFKKEDIGSAGIVPDKWQHKKYKISNSLFKNVAGAGLLLRSGNVDVHKCKFENCMNAGVLIGSEWNVHYEAGNPQNINIIECEFTNCGFDYRYQNIGKGCISLSGQGFTENVIKNIKIENCNFKNSDTAIEINNSINVFEKNNKFENIKYEIKKESKE